MSEDTTTQRNNTTTVGGAPRATAYSMVGNVLMPISRALPQRLLGVWAHPDDEAYLSAGLMARVIEAGGQVTVLTATRGEKGTDDPLKYDSDVFGAIRQKELQASLAELGVTDVRFLDLRDGECDFTDDESVVRRLVDIIGDVEPDTIVTFGPDGITNHDDHKAVSRWTTEAWRRVATPDLYYAAVTNEFLARFETVHDQLGVYADFPSGRPPAICRRDVAMEVALEPEELQRKRRALAAHATQTGPLAELMGEQVYTNWWAEETFRRPTWAETRECPVAGWMTSRTDADADATETIAGTADDTTDATPAAPLVGAS